MKKNLYYATVFKNSALENKTLDLVLLSLELPKVILLPFLRNNMGERYFSLLLALFMVGIIYTVTPYLDSTGIANVSHLYTLDVIFLVVSIIRYVQIRQAPSVFDFAKFSYSPGDPYSFFQRIKFRGVPISRRKIDIFAEPLFALIIGFIITVLFTSPAGILIMFCAVCYSVSNLLKARQGDHFIMDKIDEIICNEELSDSFAKGDQMSPRNVPIFYPDRPTNPELRNNTANLLRNDDDDDATVLS